MVKYSCGRCGKEFTQKSHHDSHRRRKSPCDNTLDKIKMLVDKAVDEALDRKLKELNYKICVKPVVDSKDNLEYSSLSKKLTKEIPKCTKKSSGIYFTPPETIYKNLKYLEPYFKNIRNVLEPSCGSGEYLKALRRLYPEIHITGIEKNDQIYNAVKDMSSGRINILHEDYLSFITDVKYDLIIGNPPYFVMKKGDVGEGYHDYFDGRPNIFILFIIKSLALLSDDGILSFVLPKGFTNCLYYEKTRRYIADNFNILNIEDCKDKYIESKQDTIILTLKNDGVTKNNASYMVNISDYTIFGDPESVVKLNSLYDNSSSLEKLGFKVSVGKVVWNQCKDILTDDEGKTRLVYSSDIVQNELSLKKYKNDDKKNYINRKGHNTPLLVVNRGYGVGNYSFDYCLIEGGFEYLIENHLICISYTKSISNSELLGLYGDIIKSLEDPRTREFISLYFGNNAINTKELNHILPIYQDMNNG